MPAGNPGQRDLGAEPERGKCRQRRPEGAAVAPGRYRDGRRGKRAANGNFPAETTTGNWPAAGGPSAAVATRPLVRRAGRAAARTGDQRAEPGDVADGAFISATLLGR